MTAPEAGPETGDVSGPASVSGNDRPRHLLIAGLFLLITLVQTWPLVLELPRVMPNDLGDPLLNTWILWWNAHAVPLTAHWWNAPIFYPAPGAMAFSETLLGESLLASPVQWLGGGPIVAYNLLFLLSFPLCAFCAYLLAWSLTRRTGPSIVAGLMYGFAIIRYAHVSHIQIEWTWWMPLALLGLHRWLTERRLSALVLFSGAWLGQSLSNGYYFFYFSVIVGLWIVWFTRWNDLRDVRRMLVPVLIAWTVGVTAMAPVLLGYRQIQQRYQFTRSIDEVDTFSADLTDFFRLSSVPRFLHVARWERPECEVSLPVVGLCALVVALIAGARGGLRRHEPRWFSMAHGVAWAIALALAAGIVGGLMLGNRHVRLGPVDFGSVPRLMVTAVPMLLVLLAFSPTAAQAWRARSASAFYLGALFVSITMAMGPLPRVFRLRMWDHSPYLTLMELVPGFTGLRVPARFALVAVLCLSILTALVLARLKLARVGRERLVFGAIAMALMFETWPGWFRLADLPHVGPDLTTASTVVELPLNRGQGLDAMYRAMYHRRPIMNGYSGYFPPAPDVIGVCFYRNDTECLDRLWRVIGSMDLMIEKRHDTDGRWEKVVRALPDVQFRTSDADFAVYRLPSPASRLAPPPSARNLVAIPAKGMTATIDQSHASWAIDRNWDTAWTTDRGQANGDSVTIEVSEPALIGAIELEPGAANPQDFPIALRIELSDDGQRWAQAFDGSTDDARLATLLLQGLNSCRITFTPRQARFVRLTETVLESARPWSIAELTVLRVP